MSTTKLAALKKIGLCSKKSPIFSDYRRSEAAIDRLSFLSLKQDLSEVDWVQQMNYCYLVVQYDTFMKI